MSREFNPAMLNVRMPFTHSPQTDARVITSHAAFVLFRIGQACMTRGAQTVRLENLMSSISSGVLSLPVGAWRDTAPNNWSSSLPVRTHLWLQTRSRYLHACTVTVQKQCDPLYFKRTTGLDRLCELSVKG